MPEQSRSVSTNLNFQYIYNRLFACSTVFKYNRPNRVFCISERLFGICCCSRKYLQQKPLHYGRPAVASTSDNSL